MQQNYIHCFLFASNMNFLGRSHVGLLIIMAKQEEKKKINSRCNVHLCDGHAISVPDVTDLVKIAARTAVFSRLSLFNF